MFCITQMIEQYLTYALVFLFIVLIVVLIAMFINKRPTRRLPYPVMAIEGFENKNNIAYKIYKVQRDALFNLVQANMFNICGSITGDFQKDSDYIERLLNTIISLENEANEITLPILVSGLNSVSDKFARLIALCSIKHMNNKPKLPDGINIDKEIHEMFDSIEQRIKRMDSQQKAMANVVPNKQTTEKFTHQEYKTLPYDIKRVILDMKFNYLDQFVIAHNYNICGLISGDYKNDFNSLSQMTGNVFRATRKVNNGNIDNMLRTIDNLLQYIALMNNHCGAIRSGNRIDNMDMLIRELKDLHNSCIRQSQHILQYAEQKESFTTDEQDTLKDQFQQLYMFTVDVLVRSLIDFVESNIYVLCGNTDDYNRYSHTYRDIANTMKSIYNQSDIDYAPRVMDQTYNLKNKFARLINLCGMKQSGNTTFRNIDELIKDAHNDVVNYSDKILADFRQWYAEMNAKYKQMALAQEAANKAIAEVSHVSGTPKTTAAEAEAEDLVQKIGGDVNNLMNGILAKPQTAAEQFVAVAPSVVSTTIGQATQLCYDVSRLLEELHRNNQNNVLYKHNAFVNKEIASKIIIGLKELRKKSLTSREIDTRIHIIRNTLTTMTNQLRNNKHPTIGDINEFKRQIIAVIVSQTTP